jgi:DNA invertase Pin-like site-specific DNA recombinase
VQNESSPGTVDSINLRAAQYVRMSTDHQKYSTQNQEDAIADYAARHNLTIVRTYADEGRSGLRIGDRQALKDLLSDVLLGRADFDRILVYDVSRWGRFQDADESAHYEFICIPSLKAALSGEAQC